MVEMLSAVGVDKKALIVLPEADKKVVTFVISDTGQPFDPTKEADADITLPAEKRPVGGLGIHLVRHIMDSISYEYADHRNILTLRKKFNKQEVL